jgi:amino acid transporter
VVSIFMERTWGPDVARAFTALILLTTYGSVFALLLGYSRIPYAAAQDGCFFPAFGKLHPTKDFPHLSLLAIGAIAIACSFIELDKIIAALLTTRIIVQFIGQNIAVMQLRKHRPDMERPYRVWLYPLPNLIALVGWIYLFTTSGGEAIGFGLLSLALGVVFYLVWSARTRDWPFEGGR